MTQEQDQKTIAFVISIAVHGAFLCCFHFLVFLNTAQLPNIMNQVTFDLKEVVAPSSIPPPNLPKVTKITPVPPPKPTKNKPQENTPQPGNVVQPDDSPVTEKKEIQTKEASTPMLPEKEDTTEPPTPTPPIEEEAIQEEPSSIKEASTQEGTKPAPPSEKAPENTVDERALYTTNQKKETGALLELTGWLWDTMPSPQDSTEETGKIVFEIKVDSMGEVISVKTLEKTISASTEKIYKISLEQLTFSKIDEDLGDEGISTGKITFFIRAR